MYRRRRKAVVYIPKRIPYFDCLPAELIQIIVSACPFSCLSVCRQFFGIARQAIVNTLLAIPEPVTPNRCGRRCYSGGKFVDLLKEMKSEHSLWYTGQFIGLSLSCLNEPMEEEKKQFLQKLVLYDDGMALYYNILPCRDNINLFNVLTDNTTNPIIITHEDRVAYRILFCPLITRTRKQTLIKVMAGYNRSFRMVDYQYRPLQQQLLDDIIAEPNSQFCFFLSDEFGKEHFDLVKEMYKKRKITSRAIKMDTIYNKDLLVIPYMMDSSDSDYDNRYERDIYDRYDDVIVNAEACRFIDWARDLKD
uniref:F-box domain-containing protein n=1 Tax=Clandestinovirus TaxID=2831644 RepID=A0A8F8KM71_9VIRU|nr:hypothetical protein KOM_12_449 [Clandestinovirus]